MLTQAELKSFAHYDPETGVFTRTRSTGPSVKAGELLGSVSHKDFLSYYKVLYQGRSYCLHRLAYLYMTGDFPKGHIDHIDGDGLNNRWDNLRVVSREQNQRNRSLNKNSTTGIPGVSWIVSRKEYKAAISVDGSKRTIGYYKHLFDAACARKGAENRANYHPNHGRVRIDDGNSRASH
jgi:hypothetical protein